MTLPNGWDGPPPPELLAAYADGELDGHDAVLPLKHKVEAWLKAHPEARADLEAQVRLRRLWRDTAPAEPDDAAWNRVLARLPIPPSPVAKTRFPIRWAAALLLASAASVAVYFGTRHSDAPGAAGLADAVIPAKNNTPPNESGLDNGEIFAVATSDEIEILRVEGQDVRALAVSDPNLHRFELMGPGEAALTQRPPTRGVSIEGSHRPMIVSRLDSEMNDD
jgi:hypothetical protein